MAKLMQNMIKVYPGTHRGRPGYCWKKLNGKVGRRVGRPADPIDAEIKRREIEEELNAAVQHEQSVGAAGKSLVERYRDVPLTEQLPDYLASMRADGTGEFHVGMTGQRNRRILEATGIRYARELSPSLIKCAIAEFRQLPTGKKPKRPKSAYRPLSAQSRNFYIQAIKQFVRWLYVERRIAENPLLVLKKWGVLTDRRHDRVRITWAEFARLVAAANRSTDVIETVDGPTRALIYRIAYATGFRRGEIASLTKSSFRLLAKQPTVTVQASHTKNGETAVMALHADLVPILKLRLLDFADDEPLFPGLAWKKTATMIRRDLKAAGIPYTDEDGKFRDFHALRHSFISAVWEAGATPPVAQRLARHSDIRLTMKYSHTNVEDLDAVIRRMPGLPGAATESV